LIRLKVSQASRIRIMVNVEYQQQQAQITLRPNCSASWQSNQRILAAVLMVNVFFASGFVAMGAWLVLPFMGLELLLIWHVLRKVFSKLQLQQIVRLDSQKLLIESGHRYLEQRWQWPRQTCSVLVTVLPHPWDPLHISLSHCGEQIALGRFLNKDDSGRLLEELRKLGLPIRQFGIEGCIKA
jgi:uncharacterized membrane protein